MPRTIQLDSRETWLAARRLSLGASEAPVALGESPWGSPFELWAEKSGRLEERPKRSEAAEERLEWGLLLEEPIAKAVAKRNDREVELEEPFRISYDEEYPFLSGTLDARQMMRGRDDPGVLQIKTGNSFAMKDWKDESGAWSPPLTYLIQLQQEIAVSGLAWGSLACLIGGQRLLGPFDFDADPAYREAIVPELVAFWNGVQEGVPPSADNRDATTRALARYRTKQLGEPHIMSDLANDWAREYRDVKAIIKANEAKAKELKNLMMAEMLTEGDGATLGLLGSGGHIEIRKTTAGPYEVKRHTKTALYIN